MTKDAAVWTKAKIKGEVNYPPFEQFDEETEREIKKFNVYPLGKIHEFSRHIPYNSEKKSFLEKTGRESFEVFQYTYRIPGNDKEYTVMWDYNIGLVRITPFFKSLGHSKTTPAKMLNQNLGLKEITHSITGGALAAQGYWMPYQCALAVCTTFCSSIGPALIPIFGPSFPSQCVDLEAPEHGRMTIDHSLIVTATEQAEIYRQHYSSFTSKSTAGPRASCSPSQSSHHSLGASSTTSGIPRRLRLKRALGDDSPFGTTDTEFEDKSETSSGDGYFCSLGTPSTMSPQAWGPPPPPSKYAHANCIAHSANSSINIAPPKLAPGPNPWLSAIPRSTALPAVDIRMGNTEVWRNKRRAEELEDTDADLDADADADADGEESSGAEDKASKKSESTSAMEVDGGVEGAEKKAAWLLMKLSVKDGQHCDGEARREKEEAENVPRVKRRRATSY